ncbi:hypothetical protein FIBSPDRAFT_936519 [Athelia psychrophila]|uniref:Uncharacterized protein n=1 Tax=Athelia psychrophila TaxID=1759441 RepID=A0A166C0H9_9AGAM|nr:hypothetical protein FIBSPDRAFT_936519 [Fibularhizoctonia sp. CBS 109695]
MYRDWRIDRGPGEQEGDSWALDERQWSTRGRLVTGSQNCSQPTPCLGCAVQNQESESGNVAMSDERAVNQEGSARSRFGFQKAGWGHTAATLDSCICASYIKSRWYRLRSSSHMQLQLRHPLSLRIQVQEPFNNNLSEKEAKYARADTENLNGSGIGYDLSVNSSYDDIATFTAVSLNGTISDLHEVHLCGFFPSRSLSSFQRQITSNSTDYGTVYQLIQYDLTLYCLICKRKRLLSKPATMDPYAQQIAIGTAEYNTPNTRDPCEMN